VDYYYQLPTGRVACVDGDCEFPSANQALTEPNGLVAIGGDLSEKRILKAYKNGIFPWFSEGEPILWWSPNPRMVLFPEALKISNSLKKTIKKQAFEIKFNSNFEAVIRACSQTPRAGQNGTWITEEMIKAYCQLHHAGIAISAEAWQNSSLVGGCYGIQIGRMFYGESMFHRVTDASKVAFVHLVEYLKKQNVGLIDCQMKTAHLASFGAKEIPRAEFIATLSNLTSTA
jgi:leucyl/phenylalanyl-tRNA--protein transferase